MATAATALLVEAETFSASSQHDALGRVLTAVSPDGSEVDHSYDEGGGLQTVTLNHRGSVTEETVVGDITYDAKGRREQVVHGSSSSSSPSTTTSYIYDPISQRLTRLRTVRHSDDASIQSLHYRKRINGDLDLERESLHISDGTGRICIIETKTVETEDPVASPTEIWRYQHGNHLGSAATEVDGSGAIISYIRRDAGHRGRSGVRVFVKINKHTVCPAVIWRRGYTGVCAALVALLQVVGCGSTMDILAPPLLDTRVPSLRPETAGTPKLVSRHVCGAHTTVDIWHKGGEGEDVRVSMFDSYKCVGTWGIIKSDTGEVAGSTAILSRSDCTLPLSIVVGSSGCEISLAPLGPGNIYVMVDVDEMMEQTSFHTYTASQDRKLARMLRKREANARSCREQRQP